MARSFVCGIWWLLSVLFFEFGCAQHGVNFLFPPSGLTLNYLDTVNVTWTSNFTKPLLYTFCNTISGNDLNNEQTQNVTAFNSSELITLGWANVYSCYFDLRPNTSTGYGANSPVIQVVATARATPVTIGIGYSGSESTSSSSSSTTTGTSTSTSTSATSTITSPASATTSPAAQATIAKGGLSKGAQIGIGVGVAVAALIFGSACLACLILRRRRDQTRGLGELPGSDGEDRKRLANGQDYNMQAIPGSTHKPRELSSDVTHEMPSETSTDAGHPHELSPVSAGNLTLGSGGPHGPYGYS